MTFSGLLNKSFKHHAAATNSNSATAQGTKPGTATTTATTTTTTTATQERHTPHHAAKTDAANRALEPGLPQPSTSIDPPTVLSVVEARPPSAQLQLLSSPTATVSKLDLKQPHPTPLSPPSTTPSSPASAIGAITSKKKSTSQQQQQQQQTLSPAQSASYRKRLNVNQVCDWCRYRKIRCDREAPCNSCQHSKRECIRTPPEVLLANLNKQNETSSADPATTTTTPTTTTTSTTKATKRSSPADDQDGQLSSSSGRAKKVARSNSMVVSHIDSVVAQQSMALSPTAMGPLRLSLPTTLELSLCGEQQQQLPMLSSPLGGGGVQASSLQDQDHLERMRRIEMLLSNVIPGAAEFIAHGLQRNSNSNNSASVDSLQQAGRENHQQQQQHVLSPISPSLTAAGSPVGLGPVQDECCSPIQVESGRRASVFAGQDYIERMKRIELLLGSVQDTNNAAVAQLSVPAVAMDNIAGKKSSDEAKKEPTRKNKAGNKKVARNSDGTIIKRPHVAAGFAGQKPPPKLPQAIAEAAQKKLAGKKKKRAANANANASSASSAASAPAPAVVAVAPATTTVSSVDPARATSTTGTSGSIAPVSWNTATVTTAASAQGAGHAKANTRGPVTLSPTKSFDIPTTIDHDTMGSFTPQQLRQQHHRQQQQQTERNQILARHQQQQRPGRLNTQLRTIPVSYHPHSKQQQQHASYTSLSSPTPASYLQGGLLTNIGSISIPTIPLSNALASYESLVVPASTSVESSPASSPRVKTTTIEISSSVAPTAASTMLMMEGDREFLGYGPASSLHRESGGEFSMALSHQDMMAQLASPIDGNGQVLLPFGGPLFHHLQQHQNHHAMHIPQVSCTTTTNNTATMTTAGMTDFASLGMVGMNESLESWMNSQVVPPLDGLIPGLAPPASSVSSHDVSTSAAAAPISYLQGLHQHQHQDRAMWMPTLGQSNVSLPLTQGSSFVQPPYVGLGQHQHRASTQRHQHQHQQSFYIPQIQDDDEDEDDGEDAEEETSD